MRVGALPRLVQNDGAGTSDVRLARRRSLRQPNNRHVVPIPILHTHIAAYAHSRLWRISEGGLRRLDSRIRLQTGLCKSNFGLYAALCMAQTSSKTRLNSGCGARHMVR
jgi:hypothetical protein